MCFHLHYTPTFLSHLFSYVSVQGICSHIQSCSALVFAGCERNFCTAFHNKVVENFSHCGAFGMFLRKQEKHPFSRCNMLIFCYIVVYEMCSFQCFCKNMAVLLRHYSPPCAPAMALILNIHRIGNLSFRRKAC